MKNIVYQVILIILLIIVFLFVQNAVKLNNANGIEGYNVTSKIEESESESESESELKTSNTDDARNAVYRLMKSYETSRTTLNLEKTLQHFSPSPDFAYFSNGKMLNYEEFSKGLAQTFSNFEKIEGGFDTIYIEVIKPDVVTAIAPFQETLIDKSQKSKNIKGTISLTAVKKGEEWKFVHGSTFR